MKKHGRPEPAMSAMVSPTGLKTAAPGGAETAQLAAGAVLRLLVMPLKVVLSWLPRAV